MAPILILLASITSLLSNPKVQQNPVLLGEVSTIAQQANALIEDYTAVQTPQESLPTLTEPSVQPTFLRDYSTPLLGSEPIESPPSQPITTAWIAFNNQIGTISLSSNSEGTLSWGSENADSCNIVGPQGSSDPIQTPAGKVNPSGSATIGTWYDNISATLTITCHGLNDASDSVTLLIP